MEKFSFGQQVFVAIDGKHVQGTISKIEQGEDDEYVYHVSSSEAPTKSHGPFKEEEIRIV